MWREDDGQGGEYVIHLDGLLTESAWVSVRVSKCMHMLCPVEGEMAVYMPSDGEENGMSCDGE